MAERSHSRRTWYSMYVLDRLLALQLGRPMAIHEADFHVDVPCMDDLSPFVPLGTPRDHSRESEEMMMMCYFIEVIKFSHIVGLVIHELYRPSQIDTSPDQMLHSAADLDQRLSEWKTQLPRHLRFDLGHLFEKSISFKRQVSIYLHL
jgi:Fungal specific transcription factor domain